MRICSLLPSTTEIVYALDLGDDLVGVTHECDYPAQASSKAVVTRSAVDSEHLSSNAIDALVASHLHNHRGLYHLDRALLEQLNPDLILTQELCDVCAVSYAEVQAAVRALFGERTILSLEPTRLADVFASIVRVGEVVGKANLAQELATSLHEEVKAIAGEVQGATYRPRVACLEWLDPPWVGGHWVPEMVELAGGTDGLGEAGAPSIRVTWESVIAYEPEVIVLMPCGFNTARAIAEIAASEQPPGWSNLPAVQNGQVYAVDANAYFSRPGPRLVTGLRILAHILHPDRTAPPPDAAAFRRLG